MAKLLGTHEWGVAIMYRETISASGRGRSREEDMTKPSGKGRKLG